MTEFERYLNDVVKDYDEFYPQLRWGQTYLNVLSRYQPNMVLYIVGDGRYDPFYNDKKIEEFLIFVRKNWGNYD
jgi:hypothetical protein